MQLNAVPQFQGSMTERSPKMPEGSIVLAELASRVLGVPINMVDQDRGTSPTEGGVANRAWDGSPDRPASRGADPGDHQTRRVAARGLLFCLNQIKPVPEGKEWIVEIVATVSLAFRGIERADDLDLWTYSCPF